MDTVILGSQANHTYNNGNVSWYSLYGFLTGPLAENLVPVQGGCLTYGPGTVALRMYVYEWNAATPSASTFITRSAIYDPANQPPYTKLWVDFIDFEGAVELEAGKQYYVAISARGTSGNVPYYTPDGNTYGAARTSLGSFPVAAWDAGDLPNISTLRPGTREDGTQASAIPGIYLECEKAGYALSDVNGDNVIVRNGPVVINGTFPAGDLTVEIGGHPLVVDSATDTTIVCAPVDVFATPLSFGTHTLTVTELELPGLSVSLTIDPEHQVVTLTSVTPPLITQGLSAAVGNQVACLKSVGGSVLEMSPEGDVVYWPAMVDGNSHPRYWYDGSSHGILVQSSSTVALLQVCPASPCLRCWSTRLARLR